MSRNFADIQARKKPNETSIEVFLSPELTRALGELQSRYAVEKRRDEKENRNPIAPGIQKDIDALIEELEDHKEIFSFKDPGRRKFDDLVEACPPSEEEKAEAKALNQNPPSWGADEFVPGLLALASLDPKLSFDDAKVIYDEWGRGDVEALFNTALQACLEQASVPFTRRDTDAILASVRNLISQQSEESPTAST